MRIISPFSDFYDALQRYGQDQSKVLLRRSSTYAVDSAGDLPKLLHSWALEQRRAFPAKFQRKGAGSGAVLSVAPGFLLVGGRFYPYACVEAEARPGGIPPAESRFQFVYDLESLESLVEDVPRGRQKRRVFRARPGWDEFFVGVLAPRTYADWAVDQRIALLALDARSPMTLTLNPRLADFQFYRVAGPEATYQQLEQFLGNLVAPEPLQQPVADKYKVLAHGFDEQSFRKAPALSRRARRQSS